MNSTPVNLVVFTSREELATLIETTTCALAAVPQSSTIDVVVNGNKASATAMRQWLATHEPERSLTVHAWLIDAPDKGNAWNQHVHTIWRDDCHAIHIDGYVRIDAASVAAMISTLASNPSALGTSAVPGMGKSAEALRKMTLEQGGFHGGLCAIEAGALRTMRQRGICVPRGLYRVDGLVGAFLSFGLDNTVKDWNPKRFIPLTPEAGWRTEPKKWYRLRDVLAWNRRRRRQARGDFENAAIRFFMTTLRRPLEELPRDVHSLVMRWAEACPEESLELARRGHRHRDALRWIQAYEPPDDDRCRPVLVAA